MPRKLAVQTLMSNTLERTPNGMQATQMTSGMTMRKPVIGLIQMKTVAMRHKQPDASPAYLSEALVGMLQDRDWSFFVTLSSNDRSRASKSSAPSFSTTARAAAFMRDRLRNWDARVNRALLGKHWLVKPDERLQAFAVLEKPASNPHWHLLVKMRCRHPKRDFIEVAEEAWLSLVAAGSVDVQPVASQVGLSRYMTKSIPYGRSTDRTAILPEISAS